MTGRFRTYSTPHRGDPENAPRNARESASGASGDEKSSTNPFRLPDLSGAPGSAVFWPCGSDGWDHPPVLFSNPVLILRVNRHTGTTVETPEGEVVAQHDDCVVTPFQWIDEILEKLDASSRGTARKLFLRPACPVATVAMSYEYGRYFNPHENCFPHSDKTEVDDMLVGFHTTGFARLDNRWNLIGRPASRSAQWHGWKIDEASTAWPRPPLIGRKEYDAEESSAMFGAGRGIDLPGGCMSESDYGHAFDAIQRHLHVGNIYQANLTVRFDGTFHSKPERVFRRGLEMGGDRFACLFRTSDSTHVSFSPELFLRKWGRSICTHPIKGTRAFRDAAEMQEAARDLASAGKDRAEHVMIVDLERNDLGRICEYGSVRVDPLMDVTSHPSLLHLESTVYGTLRSRVTCREVLAALFPGGSVTGAPKKRSMEILGGLENRPRGIYCGAMGWIDARGDMEFNLPIRTGTFFDDKRVQLHAGGGIVADSDIRDEVAELRAKLRFMLKAMRAAGT